ncbi:MAG: protein phosphatase 2C domain-containing protein [Bifidobacteriaceae bacterium]|nr:protein phosphatase 2C domain-containing protein [Bifidobacteriaceae bacterium]
MPASALVHTDSAAVTDIGLTRPLNEDAVVARFPVFMVADGMGGHDAGDRASGIVAEEMGLLANTDSIKVAEVKNRLFAARHRIMALYAARPERAAGTTVSGVVVIGQAGVPYWLVVNLGDSRTYRLADATLEQLSVDHSEVQELIDRGALSPDQARVHPQRNVVTRALGAGVLHDPDYWLVPIEEHDRVLVCTDGLTTEVTDARIAALLLAHRTPAEAARALVEEALGAGGRDNISVIVVDAWDVAGAAEDAEPTRDGLADSGSEDTVPRPDIELGGRK